MRQCNICGAELFDQDLCWCGFNTKQNQHTRCTANEEFIYINTKTSHKRFESMVVYALHYSLRDLELRSQYHVQVDTNSYLIDLYSPALKLAIEIDEPYHFQIDQKQKDDNRQQKIIQKLGCEFYRIDCSQPIYAQVDNLISVIKQRGYDSWRFQRPNFQKKSGDYSAKHWKKLEESGVIYEVEKLSEKVSKELGFAVDNSPINGIPGVSNGEYGFIVGSDQSPHKLAVYARASHKWHVRIVKTEAPDEELMQPAQLASGKPRFYKLKELMNGTKAQEKVLETVIKWLR